MLGHLRAMHDGELYRAHWGRRMRGEGPYAALIEQRFQSAIRRLGLREKVPKLTCDLFQAPMEQSAQMELFESGIGTSLKVGFQLEAARRRRGRRAGALSDPVPSLAEEKSPKAVLMASSDGISLLGRVSNASRMADKCTPMVPQQPPIICAPLSRAITA